MLTTEEKPSFVWTDELLQQAKAMALAGKSSQQICEVIGAPSRHAVISKLNRHGDGTTPNQASNGRPILNRLYVRRAQPERIAVSAYRARFNCSAVGLMNKTDETCRAVRSGFVGLDGYPIYCGDPRTWVIAFGRKVRSSYCASHHTRYHQQPEIEFSAIKLGSQRWQRKRRRSRRATTTTARRSTRS